jgi:hypothetical protein
LFSLDAGWLIFNFQIKKSLRKPSIFGSISQTSTEKMKIKSCQTQTLILNHFYSSFLENNNQLLHCVEITNHQVIALVAYFIQQYLPIFHYEILRKLWI